MLTRKRFGRHLARGLDNILGASGSPVNLGWVPLAEKFDPSVAEDEDIRLDVDPEFRGLAAGAVG